MSRLLHRSKSTRELKSKPAFLDEDPAASAAAFTVPPIPQTPNKLTRKRAGTEGRTIGRSKSIADLKVTIRNGLVVPKSTVAVPSSNANAKTNADKSSPIRPLPKTVVAPTPPSDTVYMHSFPARTTSRVNIKNNNYSPVNQTSSCIGIAIGSPTEEKQEFLSIQTSAPPAAAVQQVLVSAQEASPTQSETPSDATHGSAENMGQLPETKSGWRKFFAKFSSSKKNALAVSTDNSRAPSPYSAGDKSGTDTKPKRPKHIPIPGPPAELLAEAQVAAEEQKQQDHETQDRLGMKGPKLAINIPEAEMERYSVMFGGCMQTPKSAGTLGSSSPQKSPQKSPSTIFDRRAAKLANEGKKDLQLDLGNLKRHATTAGRATPDSAALRPSPTKPIPATVANSPSDAHAQVTRLTRSNTTTALTRNARSGPGFVMASMTPEVDSFPASLHDDSIPVTALSPPPPMPLQAALSLPPMVPKRSSRRKRSLSLVSKVSEESETLETPRSSFEAHDDSWLPKKSDEEILTSPHPEDHAAFWEMVTGKAAPQHPPQTEEEVMLAAQVSIKRQISLSQRQLLTPIVRGTGRPRRNTEKNGVKVSTQAVEDTPTMPK